MKKILIIISVFSIIFAITKIKGIDINNELYPTSIAFDYSDEKEEFTLYFQIINPSFLSKNENVNNFTTSSTFTLKQNGNSFYDCYNKLNSVTKQRISLRHIQSMIITNNLLKHSNKTHELFCVLIKNPTIPANIYVYATSKKIEDIYNNKNVMDESSYFSLLDNPQDSNIGSIIYPNTLLDICISILDNHKMYYLPSIFLDEEIEVIDDNGEKKKNKVLNLDGCFFTTINDYNFIYFKLNKIRAFQYLYKKNINALEINTFENKYFLRVHNIKSKIIVKNSENILTLKLLDIDLICPQNSNIDFVKKTIEDIIKDDIIDLYNISILYNIDIFNINDLRYRHKKSLNVTELTINIKTTFQTVQYYFSTTT